MRVLYIGATGRLGRDVVPLLREKHELTLAALGGGEVDGLPVRDLDIADFRDVERVVAAGDDDGRPFEAVVNCAIAEYRKTDMSDTDQRFAYEEACLRVNAAGAYHIYEASARAGVGRVVYISSMTSFIGPPEPETFDKETRDQPLDIYACSKVFGEHAGRYYAHRLDCFWPQSSR